MNHPTTIPVDASAVGSDHESHGEPAAVDSSERRTSCRRVYLFACSLCVATLWAYRNSFIAPFTFDDFANIVSSDSVRLAWWEVWRFQSNRPLLDISLAFNFWLGGTGVLGYHVFNLAVHETAGLALFGVVRRTLALARFEHLWTARAADWLAFVVALLWMVHPLQTESVTYIVQRCESMMGMFFLLTLYGVIRGSTSARRWVWYGLALASAALGMLCKEVMAMAPLVVLIYDWTFLGRRPREIIRRYWWLHGLLFTSAVALVARSDGLWSYSRYDSMGFGYTGITPWQYLRTQPNVILHYLKQVVWPYPQCIDWAWPVATTAQEILMPGLVVVGLLAGSVYLLARRSPVGFLGMSFFLILAPSSSIVPIADLAFEHRMYLPLAPAVVLLVLGIFFFGQRLFRQQPARTAFYYMAAVGSSLTLIFSTIDRNRDYVDSIELWRQVVELAPHNSRGYVNLGRRLGNQGDLEAELACYRKAVELDTKSAFSHLALGHGLAKANDEKGAVREFCAALELEPSLTRAYAFHGDVFDRQRQPGKAIEIYRKGLAVVPNDSLLLRRLGMSCYLNQQTEEAITTFRHVLHVRPQSPDAMAWLSWILATNPNTRWRDGVKALSLAREVTANNPEYRHGWLALAAAYAERGDYRRAIVAIDLALAMADASPAEDVECRIREQLATYQRGQPYREFEPMPVTAASATDVP